jgi:hypothetical protein
VDAWAFDRFVEGFSGFSANIKRLSDSVTKDFGPDTSGRFPWSDLFSWLAGADADLVQLYSQKVTGIGLTGLAGTTLALVRSGVVQRLGTTFSTTDGQLVRSATDGAGGVNLASAGVLATSAALPLTLSTKGYQIHILWSPNNRKKSSNDTTDPFTSDNTRENILCYGLNTTNQMIAYMGGGTSTDFTRMQFGGQMNQGSGKSSSSLYRFKAKAQYVTSYLMSQTAFAEVEHGVKTKSVALNAATTTALQAASGDNGVLAIGAVFSNSSGAPAYSASNRGSIVFAGLAITETLTASELLTFQARMGRIGQQHRAATKATVEAMLDEIVDMRDTNPTTGRLVGRKGKVSVDFNLTGSSFVFNYTHPDLGVVGTHSTGYLTQDSFQALTNYFYDNLQGSVVSWRLLETGAQNNNLQMDFGMSAGDPQVDTSDEASLLVGYHHAVPGVGTKPANAFDPNAKLGTRRKADGTLFGTNPYDGTNQTNGKYNYWTALIGMVYGEVISAYTWLKATWENTDPSAPYLLDAPIPPPVPDNIQYPYKPGQLMLHISTYGPPPGYDPAASLAIREPQLLNGHAQAWASGGGIMPLGHMDGSYAATVNTGIRQADSTHKLQSVAYQYQLQGVRGGWAFLPNHELTQAEAETIQVNWDKVFAY